MLAPAVFAQEADLETLADEFTLVDGYRAVDVMELETWIQANLEQPAHVGQLSPLALPMHAAEAIDGRPGRSRHFMSVAVRLVPMPPAADPVPVLFIELDRYNLAPLVHAELVESHGADNVAPLAEEDLVPHASFRFVIHQVMGREATISAVSRKDLTDSDAEAHACLGVPCLQTWNGVQETVAWSELQPGEPVHGPDGLSPAGMVDQLAAASYFDPYMHDAAWDATTEAITIAELVMESNLAQEFSSEAAIRIGALRDDSVAAVWKWLVAVDTGAATDTYTADAYECLRGVSEEGTCL